MLKLASFNVNSINVRIELVKKYLIDNNIDILLLQEIKCEDIKFPKKEFIELGFYSITKGQKSYNGVAIISKYPIELVNDTLSLDKDLYKDQSRFLDVKILDYRIVCVYVPNGNPLNSDKFNYKLAWLEQFYEYCKKLYLSNEKVIIGGDFNIILREIDCFAPEEWSGDALYSVKVKEILFKILNLGFVDSFRAFYPEKKEFSFWDYQNGAWQKDNGIRIDLMLSSPEVTDLILNTGIDKSIRGLNKPSDHTPVWLEIKH